MTATTKILALAAALALASVAPAQAYGGFHFGLNIGVPFFAPYAPVCAYPPPPVWHYPLMAPTVVVPTPWPPQPDEGTRWVQSSLNVLMGTGLNVDGIAGPATWNAIAAFQAANGLAVDGIAGTATMTALHYQMAAHAPPPPPSAVKEPPTPPAEK